MAKKKEGLDLPTGLGSALLHNEDAMRYFSGQSMERQMEIIRQSQGIRSREEMRSYVSSLPCMLE